MEAMIVTQLKGQYPQIKVGHTRKGWVETISNEPVSTCPWAYQQIKDYTEFKSKDKQILLKMIKEHVNSAIAAFDPKTAWHFHSVRRYLKYTKHNEISGSGNLISKLCSRIWKAIGFYQSPAAQRYEPCSFLTSKHANLVIF